MRQLSDIIRSVGFHVKEADFACVGDFWKDIVFYWKHYRFYYVESGSAQMNLRSVPLRLQAGRLYYIPQNSVVTATDTRNLSHYFIHFKLNETGNTLFNSLAPTENGIPATPEDAEIFRAVTRIFRDREQTVSTQLLLNGLMQILLSRFITGLDSEGDSRDILRFFDLISYIQSHIEERITVRELAEMAHLNESYFSHCFAKAVGCPPLQYILDKKLERAMRLMQDDRMSIKEIAYRLRFSDEMYFSRLFRRKIGIPPSEFRRILRQRPDLPKGEGDR